MIKYRQMSANELIEIATKHYDTSSIDLLKKAIDFATKKHEGQMRKSGEPYITHPLSVAALLVEWGMDTDTVVAGVLHRGQRGAAVAEDGCGRLGARRDLRPDAEQFVQ